MIAIPNILQNKRLLLIIGVVVCVLVAYFIYSQRRKAGKNNEAFLVNTLINDIDAGLGEGGRDDFRSSLLTIKPDTRYNPKKDADIIIGANTFFIKYIDRVMAVLSRLSRNQLVVLDAHLKRETGNDLQETIYQLCRTDWTSTVWKKFSLTKGVGDFIENTGFDRVSYQRLKTIVANSPIKIK